MRRPDDEATTMRRSVSQANGDASGRPSLLVGALAIVALVAACVPAAGDLGTIAPPPSGGEPSLPIPSAEATPGTEPSGSPDASPGATTTVRSYFVLGDSGLVPVLRTVPKTQAIGRAAMTALLDATFLTSLTSRPALTSAIPDGTRLLGLTIDQGVATVNLSGEFGAGGPSGTIVQRYAQVVYTLAQFPTVNAVIFQLDGLNTHAWLPNGVGTEIARPADYQDVLPAIAVDDPAWNGVLRSGDHVSGTANVFEAQFRLMVLDAAGHALTDVPVHASCGSGCRGTFDAAVAFAVKAAQWGTLRVFEPSAKDGSPTNIVDYRVWLTP